MLSYALIKVICIKQVYDEIKILSHSVDDPKTHLQSLEIQGLIEVIDDKWLLDLLFDVVGKFKFPSSHYSKLLVIVSYFFLL